MKDDRAAVPWALTAVALWSTVATAFELALRELSPADLLAFAVVISWLALGAVLLVRRIRNREWITGGARRWAQAALLGLLNPVIYYLILFTAYHRLPAQVAQPLNYTWPLFLAILAAPLSGIRPAGRDMAALGISFIGVVVIAGPWNSLSGDGLDRTGVFLALGSGVVWALYWLLSRRLEGDDGVRLFAGFTAAVAVLIPMWIIRGAPLPTTPVGWSAAVWTGLFEMGVTFIAWSRALEKAARPARIGNLVYLGPFISLLWIRLILREPIRPATVIGLAVIVGGILWGRRNVRAR